MSFSARVRSHIPSYSQYYWLIGWPDLAWEGTTQKRENWKARVVGGGGSWPLEPGYHNCYTQLSCAGRIFMGTGHHQTESEQD